MVSHVSKDGLELYIAQRCLDVKEEFCVLVGLVHVHFQTQIAWYITLCYSPFILLGFQKTPKEFGVIYLANEILFGVGDSSILWKFPIWKE